MVILGKSISIGNIILFVAILVLGIIGLKNQLSSNKLLEHSATTKCKVKWTGSTSGNRYGQPECICEFIIDGESKPETYELKRLKVNIGDCLEIKYSLDDHKVTRLNYEKGVVPCD